MAKVKDEPAAVDVEEHATFGKMVKSNGLPYTGPSFVFEPPTARLYFPERVTV